MSLQIPTFVSESVAGNTMTCMILIFVGIDTSMVSEYFYQSLHSCFPSGLFFFEYLFLYCYYLILKGGSYQHSITLLPKFVVVLELVILLLSLVLFSLYFILVHFFSIGLLDFY